MIDYNAATKIALEALSKVETVIILNENQKIRLGFPVSGCVWEITTEIQINNACKEIRFHLVIPLDFPFIFPKLYLSQKDYDELKYLPHVDDNRFVCTFDTELSRPNFNLPGEVVIEILRKAKKIIAEGIDKKNLKDFKDEFLSYWRLKYDDEPSVDRSILTITKDLNNETKLTCLSQPVWGYKYILHSNDDHSTNLLLYLKLNKFKFYEVAPFVLENFEIKNEPPFNLKNHDILKYISNQPEVVERFKKFINSMIDPKLVLFKKDGVGHILGWFHKSLVTKRNGFRFELERFQVLSTFQQREDVIRISPEEYTKDRLLVRSAGDTLASREYCFAIAGLGSIGSNLLFFLNSLNKPKFKLIDPGHLKVENMGRHLLGLNYVGNYKTDALMAFLKMQSPTQNVSTQNKSIIDVCSNEQDYLNDIDYLFACIGRSNIDNWIGSAMKNQIITKPVFFIFVEPYLAGGHVLFIHPNDPKYEEFFEEDDLFRFNIISKNEYLRNNPILSLREVGCQTTYIPYSVNNVVSFLSSVFPKILSIINYNAKKSTSYTWLGNINILKKLKLTQSDFSHSLDEYSVVENQL